MKKLIAVCATFLLLTSCATTKTDSIDRCVFQDRAVKVTSDFEGTTVGFCCERCQAKWDSMSTAEKKAKLASLRQ